MQWNERPPRAPIIPAGKADRTGSSRLLGRARADIARRFAAITQAAEARFALVPVYATNEVATRTLYGLTPKQMRDLADDLQAIVDRWLLEGKGADLFWWDAYVSDASLIGVSQTAANLAGLSAAYEASRSVAAIIYSEPYQRRLDAAKFGSQEHWTGMAQTVRAELAQIIGAAVVDGKNPKAVAREIRERLGVTKSRAMLYAQTDTTNTLRSAKLAEADEAAAKYGLKLGLLWTSALLPTTRETHAERHGRVYTSANVRTFYTHSGNRYRCHCSVTECLLDKDGRPVLTDRVKALLTAEKLYWKKP